MKKTILLPVLLSVFIMTSISISAQKFYPSLDTYIQQNTATEKKDTLQGFKLECRMSASLSRVAFIEFNIGSYNKVCTKAEVNLYCYETANAGESETIEMYEVITGDFDGNSTWNSLNGNYTIGSTYLSKNAVLNADLTNANAAPAWYKFDITTLVNKVAATSGTNKKVKVFLKATTGLLAVRFYAVNVLNDKDWDFVKDFAPFLDVQSPAGINNPKNSNVASIYKNANNQIIVDCTGSLSADASVEVYNVTGQKLTTIKINSAKTIIDKTFNSGIYMINVINGGLSTNQKLILN